VTVVDKNAARIAAWKSNDLPFSEPGLLDIVRNARGLSQSNAYTAARHPLNGSATHTEYTFEGERRNKTRLPNLIFSTDVDRAIKEADMIFVSVDTPATKGGDGIEAAPNLKNFRRAIEMIATTVTHDFILVEKSTVPCGTASEVTEILDQLVKPGISFEVLSNPEFLAEGSAVSDLLHPDRVLIGSFTTSRGRMAASKLADIYARWIPRDKIVTMDTWSSELSKLAANALLAQRISSINSFSALCEKLGADVKDISRACGLDNRIGPHMLKASVGFGGSCFKKDVSHIIYISRSLDLHEVAEYWRGVLLINEYQMDRFSARISSRIRNLLGNRRIALLGFAFKANTSDTRESAAISVARSLVYNGYHVQIFDPLVSEQQIQADVRGDSVEFEPLFLERVTVHSNAYEACHGASGVAICTDWKGFAYNPSNHIVRNDCLNGNGFKTHSNGYHSKHTMPSANGYSNGSKVDSPLHGMKNEDGWTRGKDQQPVRWDRIAGLMREPKYVFDGQDIISESIEALGFKLESIGKTRS
jgi:UDPglucose 6-dehydrogenase